MRQGRLQAGRAAVQTLGATALFILTLGALGPKLDGEPYGAGPEPDPPSEAQRIEAEVAAFCRREGGENAGYTPVKNGGGFVCTDKRGRRTGNSVITVLHQAEAP